VKFRHFQNPFCAFAVINLAQVGLKIRQKDRKKKKRKKER
jgi:hypothetical protein